MTIVGPRDDGQQITASDGHRNILATARGGGFLAAGSFVEFASRFVIAFLLARTLGAGDYGLYVLAVSAATLFAGISLLGLDDAMVRYVAILSGRRDVTGLRGTVQIGLGVSALAGVVLGGVLYLGAGPIADGLFDEPRLTPLLHVVAIVVPFLTVSNVLAGIARGFHRMDFAAFAENLVQSGVRMALLGAFALVGALDTFAAAVIFGLSDVAATITLIVLLSRLLPMRGPLRHEARRDVREVFGFALPLWLSGLLRQFRRNFETLVLGATSAASSVGVYAVVNKVSLVSHVWLLSLLVSVKPTLAQLHDRGDRQGLAQLYTTTTRWALGLALPCFLALVLYREPILATFGPSFTAGAAALVILAFAELANAGTGICGPMIEMTGHTRIKVANSVLGTVLLIGGSAVLIPRWGVVGAATASLIAIAVVNVVTVIEVWGLEGLLPFDRTLWKLVAAGAGALVTGVVLGWWMPVGSELSSALLQGFAVAGVYGALILRLGLAPEDRVVLQRVGRKASRLIRRRRNPAPPAPGPDPATTGIRDIPTPVPPAMSARSARGPT